MKMRRNISAVLTAVFLAGCSASGFIASSKYFADVTPAEDDTYGYVPEQPIKLRNGNQTATMRTMYDFIGALKSESGNYLELVSRYSVDNPDYAGGGGNYGPGKDPAPMLDKILAVPQGEQDTLELYFNTFISDEVKVPKGLEFDPSRL